MYGKHHSEASKKKNSESKKRSIRLLGHPLSGKHHSEETRKKISESNKKYAAEHRDLYVEKITNYLQTHPHPMSGKHHSEETRKKISESRKKFLQRETELL